MVVFFIFLDHIRRLSNWATGISSMQHNSFVSECHLLGFNWYCRL